MTRNDSEQDLDMLATQTKLRMGPDRKRAFLKQIRSDCHVPPAPSPPSLFPLTPLTLNPKCRG